MADDYRDWLVKCRHESSKDYDKAVMTLSAGALAIAFGLLRGNPNMGSLQMVWSLITSWVFLSGSLFSSLVSFRMSFHAFHRAIEQIDKQLDENCIQREGAGGRYTVATEILNWTALGSLVVGVVFLAIFIGRNLQRLG